MRLLSLLFVCLALLASLPSTVAAQEYDSQMGWKVRAPKGWKMGQQGGQILFGSDTEAGMIVVWFEPGLKTADLKAEAKKGIHEDGLNLAPTGEATALKAKGGSAVSVMLGGADASGTALKGRAIGVAGPTGSVILLGVTTPEHFENISKRTREAADGVSFYKPKAGDAMKLRGTFCKYSSYSQGYGTSDSYSSSITRRMTFDGAGRVGWGSQTLIGGSSVNGVIGDGSTQEVGTYSVVGDTVTVRWQSGSQACNVHIRQNNGQITELMCSGKLWAMALCE